MNGLGRVDQFFHSIRFRLVLWFVLILALVMAVFSGFIYWRQAQDTRSIAMARLNFTLERLRGQDHEGEGAFEGLSASQLLSGNAPIPTSSLLQDEVVALLGSDGTILQASGLLSATQIKELVLPVAGWNGVVPANIPKMPAVESTRYLFINPAIQQNGQTIGYLLLGVPLDANNQLGRLLVSLVIGNLLTLAIALTGGFWLADRAMRPVHTITQAAQQISETDLHKRLNLKGRDELAELGNTFDGMLDRLQAAFTRQRQFTADASHELRTPLTIIDLEASRGLANHRSPAEYERILGTIQSENQSMIRLVKNLLDLARMDAGQVSLKRETIDLGGLASEVIERLEPLAKAKGVTLEVGDLPETLVHGDPATLSQMLTNLVENAIKYSSSIADPRVTVSTGAREDDGHANAWVRVSDNGIGIPGEHLAHIFDRFYQVEAARSRDSSPDGDAGEVGSSGTGLGLAIARWIAQAHGGDIRAESTVGKGSIFEVDLPAVV